MDDLKAQVLAALTQYHIAHPFRHGMAREELRTLFDLAPFELNQLLKEFKAAGLLTVKGNWIALPTHRVWFSPFERVKVDALLEKFAASPFSPPSVKDARSAVGRELFFRLLESGELVQVSDEVLFRKVDYDEMRTRICALIEKNGQVTAAETRDLFATSRKYALALLEHFDEIGLTVRNGDVHKFPK